MMKTSVRMIFDLPGAARALAFFVLFSNGAGGDILGNVPAWILRNISQKQAIVILEVAEETGLYHPDNEIGVIAFPERYKPEDNYRAAFVNVMRHRNRSGK